MHAFEDVQELSSIKYSLLDCEQAYKSNRVEQLNAIDKFSQEVDIVLVLVGSDELHDEGR